MNDLDPSYLRSIRDGILKGNIEANNSESLPNGLADLYEKELFPPTLKWKERKETLIFFLVFALAQKEISAEFASSILGDEWLHQLEDDDSKEIKRIQRINELIQLYSKRFNVSDSGKYKLYHERFRVYILQKVSEVQIIKINTRFIELCKVALDSKNIEHEEYALHYLSSHILNNSILQNDPEGFQKYFDDFDLAERQKLKTKSYFLAKKDLKLKIRYSFFTGFKNDGYKASLDLLSLNYKEQKYIWDYHLFLKHRKIEELSGWLSNYKGIRKLKLIVYILHDILIVSKNEYSSDLRNKISKELIDILLLTEDDYNLDWTTFFPHEIFFQIQIALNEVGIQNFNVWRHKINVSQLIKYSTNHLELLIRVLKETNRDDYYSNIEELIDHEIDREDFSRIKRIITSIECDGKAEVSISYKISTKYRNIDKHFFQVKCLDRVISSNINLYNSAFELQKKIINSLPDNVLKLEILLYLLNNSHWIKLHQEFEGFYSSISKVLDCNFRQNQLYLLFELYPKIINNKEISKKTENKIKSILELYIASGDCSNNIINEIRKYIDLLGLQNSDELSHWKGIKDDVVLKNNAEEKNKKRKGIPTRNPFIKTPSKTPSDYRIYLLKSFLETENKELIYWMLNVIFDRIEASKNFPTIIKCYQFLLDVKCQEYIDKTELNLMELANGSKINFNQILVLLNLHQSYKNIEQTKYWRKFIYDFIRQSSDRTDLILKLNLADWAECSDEIMDIANNLIENPINKVNFKCQAFDSGFMGFEVEEINREIIKSIDSSDNAFYTINDLLSVINNHDFQHTVLKKMNSIIQNDDSIIGNKIIFAALGNKNLKTRIPDGINSFLYKLLLNESLDPELVSIKFIQRLFSNLDNKQLAIWEGYKSSNKTVFIIVQVSYLRRLGKVEAVSKLVFDIIESEDINPVFMKELLN